MTEFTPEEKSFMERNLACPFCGSNQVVEGPSGGMSQNLYCKGTYQDGNDVVPCGARFNSTPFGMDLIQRSQMPPEMYVWKLGQKKATGPVPGFSKNDILAEFGLAKKKKWYTPWRQE